MRRKSIRAWAREILQVCANPDNYGGDKRLHGDLIRVGQDLGAPEPAVGLAADAWLAIHNNYDDADDHEIDADAEALLASGWTPGDPIDAPPGTN